MNFMKKQFTRAISLFVCAVMLMSCMAVGVFAGGEGATTAAEKPLEGSYVEFVKTDAGAEATATATIAAKAYVRNPQDNAETKAWLIVGKYTGDVLDNAAMSTLTLKGGVEDFITTTASPLDYDAASQYRAYLWYGDESMRPIRPTATYGYSGALLTGITVDGTPIADFSTDKTEYELSVGEDGVVPVTKGVTADNSVYTTTSYEQSGMNYKAVVTATSSDGTKTESYTVTYSTVAYDTTNGYKAFHAISDWNGTDMTLSSNWEQDSATQDGWWAKGSKEKDNVMLCSNLHGNSDGSNADVTGSRWVTDVSPSKGDAKAQGHQIYTVNDESLKGLDYFITHNGNRTTICAQNAAFLTFSLSKSATVEVYMTAEESFTINDEAASCEKLTTAAMEARYKEGSFVDNNASANLTDSDGNTGTLVPPYRGENADYNWSTAEILNNTDWINGNYINGDEQTSDNAYSTNYYKYKASTTITVDSAPVDVKFKMTRKLTGRSFIIVIKPVAKEVKPMYEYNMTYGGKTLAEVAEALNTTKNESWKGDVEKAIKTNEVRVINETAGSTYGDKTGPTLVDNNYGQRYIQNLQKISGWENACVTATDREMAGGGSTWDKNVFYNTDTNNVFPFTDKPTDKRLWQTFDVKRDCVVYVVSFCTNNASPTFLKEENSGWILQDYSDDNTEREISAPFKVYRGTYYGGNGNNTYHNVRAVYAKEYTAGETVQLYNSNVSDASDENLPYLTVVKFK